MLSMSPLQSSPKDSKPPCPFPSTPLRATCTSTVEMNQKMERSPFYTKLASGAIAGIVGTSIVFPVDLIKTRLQAQSTVSKTGLDCAREVLRVEGLRGFYRGLLANLIGVTPEKAIKLAVHDYLRSYLSHLTNVHESSLSMSMGLLAGAGAGLCQVLVTNPMEMVKIKMQTAQGPQVSTLSQVVRSLGVSGLYYGLSATICRDIPFSMIFFAVFSTLKSKLSTLCSQFSDNGNGKKDPPLPIIFLSGIMAGVSAAVLATPMDVVKTRLQASLEHSVDGRYPKVNLIDAYRQVWQTGNGPHAFMKGALQRCMIIAPLFALSLLTYEIQQRWWLRMK